MASLLILLLAVFSRPLVFPELSALASPISSETNSQKKHNSLIFEIQEAKRKLAQLESLFDKSTHDLNAKSTHIRHSEKRIQELNLEIDRLQTALASFEDNTSSANKKLHDLQEQIQLLWAISRNNNFEIYNLEYKARDADERFDLVRSRVEEMADIVSEQWIQIQQLEQALQMARLRASKAKKERAMKCLFVKFMKDLSGEYLEILKGILDPYVSDGVEILDSCISVASDHLKKTYEAVKYYHHQLQAYIKQTMVRNAFTAVLANDELVFFVASALITFPVLSLCTLLSSRFS